MDFRILGPLEIRQNGRSLPCKGAKQRLLLAALLLHPNEAISSDRLIDALWGDDPPPTATKALQMHVSQLRRLLPPDVIRTQPPGYALTVADGELDLASFERLVADGRAASEAGDAARLLTEALALWRGRPFADLAYEEFLQPEIARLEELRLAATEDRIDADLATGRHQELIGEIESLAAANPLRERLHAQLMLALYRSGRQADALEVYAAARKRLVDELGLEPSRRLKELQQQILEQDGALDIPSAEMATGLVGRDSEFGSVSTVIDRAVAGRGAIVLIAGEPGIGKSRLAEALARHAEHVGARVAVGRCWEAGGAPAFWPWIQALRALLDDTELDALTDLAGDAEGSDAPGARFRMFDSIAGLLRAAARNTPVTLFLDDVHAADQPSLLLLRFVAVELAQAPVAVIACYRDTEIGPELSEAIADLTREPTVTRIGLEGLDATATGELLEAAMGAEPAADLVERVQAETRGNPLFAGELGRLFASEGVPDSERFSIPVGVREAIQRRLRKRSDACRELLGVAAVAGREVDVALLERVCELSADDFATALGEATEERVIGEIPGATGRLRFSHILVRDVVYDDLPAARRAAVHRALGRAIADLHAGDLDPHAAEVAHHYLQGGPAPAAVEFALRAAAYAESQHAYEEAARHYRSALALLTETPAKRCGVLLSLGESLSRAGLSAEAKQSLRAAAALAEEHGWPEYLARAALGYGGRFAWARGSTDPALVPLLEKALDAIGDGDSAARAKLLARLAGALRDDAAREPRLALAEEAVEIARRLDDNVTRAYAIEGYWIATETPDDVGRAVEIGDELIELARKIGDAEHQFTGRDFRLAAFWKLGDRAGVDVELDVLVNLAEEMRQPSWRWWVHATRTGLTLMEGKLGEAERMIAETRASGEQAERWNAHVSERLQLFILRREQGRLAELEDLIARSVHEYPTLLRFGAARAHLYAETGDRRNARSAFDAVMARDLEHEHLDAEWLFTMALLPDACRFLGDEEAAARLYALLLPYAEKYAQAPVEAAFGSVARALGVLAIVSGRQDEAADQFEHALEIERRMRAWPWLAHVQHDYAALLRSAGEAERADALAQDAVAGYEALGMDSWAARARAL